MQTDKIIILVVDDDPAVCDALKFALELDDLIVHTCSSGTELLCHPELAHAHCVVLDYKMPDMDGFQVLERLAAINLSIPVILITGQVTDGIRKRAARTGVNFLLEKPLLNGILTERIRDIAHGMAAPQ